MRSVVGLVYISLECWFFFGACVAVKLLKLEFSYTDEVAQGP
jgi:hypothetical protein